MSFRFRVRLAVKVGRQYGHRPSRVGNVFLLHVGMALNVSVGIAIRIHYGRVGTASDLA